MRSEDLRGSTIRIFIGGVSSHNDHVCVPTCRSFIVLVNRKMRAIKMDISMTPVCIAMQLLELLIMFLSKENFLNVFLYQRAPAYK